MSDAFSYGHRWRDYRTPSGGRPVKDYLSTLSDYDYARILAAMKAVQVYGRERARHLRGDIYEVRATGETQSYRVLFAAEGRFHQVLLSLEAFSKKTAPSEKIALAEQKGWPTGAVGAKTRPYDTCSTHSRCTIMGRGEAHG